MEKIVDELPEADTPDDEIITVYTEEEQDAISEEERDARSMREIRGVCDSILIKLLKMRDEELAKYDD